MSLYTRTMFVIGHRRWKKSRHRNTMPRMTYRWAQREVRVRRMARKRRRGWA